MSDQCSNDVSGWLFGIEHLTGNATGVTYWKGAEVGFLEPGIDVEDAKKRAKTMAARCTLAEENGTPVCTRTISERSPITQAPADTPWMETMMHHLTVFEEEGRARWLVLDSGMENGFAVAVSVAENNDIELDFATERGGAHAIYMRMMKNGLRSNVRRLESYKDFVSTMQEARITTKIVSQALLAIRNKATKE